MITNIYTWLRASGIIGSCCALGCAGVVGGDAPMDNTGGSPPGNVDGIPVDGDPDNLDATGQPRKYDPLKPAAASLVRLTHDQYVNTIADVFGADVTLQAALEPDEATELFLSIGAAKVGTSQRGVEQYQDAAYEIADKVVARRSAYPWLAGCKPVAATDACVATFIQTVGRRLWRRALTDEETARYQTVVGAQGPTRLDTGLRFALAGLLKSPYFLYQVNLGEADPVSGTTRYSSIETASRLSYFIWNSTPDEALLAAGASGRLVNPTDVRAQVARMLGEARAQDLAGRFFGEAWLVSKLNLNDKNSGVFKLWNQALVDSYKEEFRRVLRDISSDDPRDVRDILTSKRSFLNGMLASVYGAPVQGAAFVKSDLGETRFGLLTSGAVLAANSPTDRSSPTRRGVFVLEKVLCREVPPPPPNVNTMLNTQTPDNGNKTVVQILEEHRSNPVCASCHSLFDPAGSTFEIYDGIGAYRTTDKNQPIDAKGELDDKTFAGISDLATYLHDQEETGRCIATRIYQYAAAHALTDGEQGVVDLAADRFADGGFIWSKLIDEVVTSPGFRLMTATNQENLQ